MRTYISIASGLIGIVFFVWLRPQIDFNANGPLTESSTVIEDRIQELAGKLSFSIDSLAVATFHQNHSGYFYQLRDSVNPDLTPAQLNENGAHIQSWISVVGGKALSGNLTGIQSVFNSTGRLLLRHSDAGKLIRLEENRDFPNPTFIQGDSIPSIGQQIVGDFFEYNLNDYITQTASVYDTTIMLESGQEIPVNVDSRTEEDKRENLINLSWIKKEGKPGPDRLELGLVPAVREYDDQLGFRTEIGYKIAWFAAKFADEPDDLNSIQNNPDDPFFQVLIVAAIILALSVFIIGFVIIFKGQVLWRRALFMFLTIALGIYGWRFFYGFFTYHRFYDQTGMFSSVINDGLFGIIVGMYAAMAYVCWEAFARKQKHDQLAIIDAAWQRIFFVKESGAAMLHGFVIAGVLLGVFATGVYLTNTVYYPTDSQFGYGEASIPIKMLTINMSAWTTVWMVGFGQVGFIAGALKNWVRPRLVSIVLSIVATSLLTATLGRLIGTSGDVYQDVLIFGGLSIILVATYHLFGIVTVNTAWWVFCCILLMMPYVNSPSSELAAVLWVQGIVIAGPVLYSLVVLKWGRSASDVGEYIPDYEQREAQHLRVEREIEMARESQYKLMPLQPPKADGFDVYGFFLPSFEVGGDFFDYVLVNDTSGNPEALVMTMVDVSGKAMQAAMPAIFTSGLLLSRLKENEPHEILTAVAEPLYNRTDRRTFITCCIARYNIQSGMVSVANAGHCKPVLKRNGVAEFIQTPSPKFPLGFKADTRYCAQEFRMKKGDVLMMYSDGLPEAENEHGERYGFDEVPRLLESIDTELLSAYEIAQEVKKVVQKFSDYQLVDDTTIICLKV
ncbi:MAG: PP2C family protein-serine/threonine phosphatase [Bacteroidota bacterium]